MVQFQKYMHSDDTEHLKKLHTFEGIYKNK